MIQTPPLRRPLGPSWAVLTAAAGLAGCGGDEEPRQGVADPLRPATGTVVVNVRQHFTGEPGVGFPVILDRSGTDARAASTDGTGQVQFVGVEAGVWELSFLPPPGFVAWVTRPSPAPVTVTAGQTLRHVFEFVPGQDAAPRGVMSVGAVEPVDSVFAVPVIGTRITAEGADGTTATAVVESNGVRIEVPTGIYTVTVQPPRDYRLAAGESGVRGVTVFETVVALVGSFELQRTSGLGGVLGWVGKGPLGSEFVPAVGAVVTLSVDGAEVAGATVDGTGYYRLDPVQPGVYTVRLSLPPGWGVQEGEAVPSVVEVPTNRLHGFSIFNLQPPG